MELKDCAVCPRACHVNRTENECGICGVTGEEVMLARAALHFYEEPCISGKSGSGAVFFSGCSLHCIYCQNEAIQDARVGRPVPVFRLAEIFLELQEKGAHNINLVTPSHYSVQIQKALQDAKENGLNIPVVYNCSGYESVETLRSLQNVIDVYLTDYKYSDASLASAFSRAPDYPDRAKEALAEMVRQQPSCVFDNEGILKRGVIVRVLLLPGHVKNSAAVVRYVHETYGDQVFLSLMNQYTPMKTFKEHPELNRKVTAREYGRLIKAALDAGVSNAYIQEGKTQEKSFIPDFDYEGI
ncbi:MAG: 4Fe-4S cluster-binding domain-containing protein [Lachnospiraceae bacterium]|nr:4Fe-4S cluster-binding domain-containing protein [Lachnospiraceae bacterium]